MLEDSDQTYFFRKLNDFRKKCNRLNLSDFERHELNAMLDDVEYQAKTNFRKATNGAVSNDSSA